MYIKTIITILFLSIVFPEIVISSGVSTPGISNDTIPELKSLEEDSSGYYSFGEPSIINIPFSKRSSKHITGSIVVVNPSEVLQFDNAHSVNQIVENRIPLGGLNIRGFGDALVVIDGVPRPISSISIEEITQITILKDVSASILYGVRANNGVVLITTKRGAQNTKNIGVSIEYGFNKPVSLPKYLGSADYMKFYNVALANDGLPPLYSPEQIEATKAGLDPVRNPDINYFSKEFIKGSKPSMKVVTEFSGGDKTAQYYVDLGWIRDQSILNSIEGQKWHSDRLNMRSNINVNISKAIKSHFDIVGIFDINKTPNGNFFNDASTLHPNYFPGLIDTMLVNDEALLKTATIINGSILGGTSIYRNNVYGNLSIGGYSRQMNTSVQFTNGFDVDLQNILKGLSFKTLVGFDFYNQYVQSISNTYAVYEPTWNAGNIMSLTKIGADNFSGAQSIGNTSMMKSNNYSGQLNYLKSIGGKHALSASAFFYYTWSSATQTNSNYNQPDKFGHIGASLNYVYNDKYIVNLNSALVNSVKFAPNNRLGLSPSFGLGWILSEEGFLKNNSTVNYLKLRASAGILNSDMNLLNSYINWYWDDVYGAAGGYSWDDGLRTNNATGIQRAGNKNLFYEKRKDVNTGIEAALFNKSLWVDINFFMGNNTNLYVQRFNTLPAFLGGLAFVPYENYGKNKYDGIEIDITWRKAWNNFKIEIGGTILSQKTELVRADELWAFDYQYRKGRSTTAIYGLESDGLFENEQDITRHAVQSFGAVQPGDVKYKDQNNDGVIDDQDQVVIGDWMPDFSGGFTLKFQYKNTSLFALATVTEGAQRFIDNPYYQMSGDNKYSEIALYSWTPDLASVATYPRLSSKSNSNNFRQSTFWMYNNSRIRLSQLQVNFDFPALLTSKTSMKHFSLYVRADNLLTFSESRRVMELNIGSEPQYRFYSVGVKVLF